MTADWTPWVLEQTSAQRLVEVELVQELWRGYGELLRLKLEGGPFKQVILKRVVPPSPSSSADGRKLHSYEIEQRFYAQTAGSCDHSCRVPRWLGSAHTSEHRLLLMEDLMHSGYRCERYPSLEQVQAGLRWLASFHARFLNQRPSHLWPEGCYWRLALRRDEWQEMPESPFKAQAEQFDHALRTARFQTLLHGDAKPPNFCWDAKNQAAAVDFQWVGPGCGIRDVALFIGRGWQSHQASITTDQWLDFYFQVLGEALSREGHCERMPSLEKEWRALYPVACSDYCRFGLGWSTSARIDSYSRVQLDKATRLLQNR